MTTGVTRPIVVTKLGTLEAMRGIAALLVVLYHLQDIFHAKAGIVPFGGIFGSGDRGVDLFFVLSGFIIMTNHAGDIGVPTRILPYLFKRVGRIYPSVWIITAVAATPYACHFGGPGKLAPWSLAASALLLPQAGPPLVNVTWTLKYEILFYAIFALTIGCGRLGTILLLAWQAAVVLAAAGVLHLTGPVTGFPLRPICVEFGIGMVGAWLIDLQRVEGGARSALIPAAVLAIGATSFIGGLLYEPFRGSPGSEAPRILVFGLGSAAIILGLAQLERDGRIRAPAPLLWLGSISYAVYLVHYPVITLAATAWLRLGWMPPNDAVLLGCALLGVAAGAGFHHLVDQPIQVRLRRLGRRLFMSRPAPICDLAAPALLAIPQRGPPRW